MKRIAFFTLVLSIVFLCACTASNPSPAAENAGPAQGLVVSGSSASKTFTRADLEALAATQSAFNDVTYKGVTVSALLQAAGFDPAAVKAIKAVATDGYTVNYDTNQVLVDNVIVAYATADGDLTADDGAFRMVLPDAEGKLNLRMLAEIQVIQ